MMRRADDMRQADDRRQVHEVDEMKSGGFKSNSSGQNYAYEEQGNSCELHGSPLTHYCKYENNFICETCLETAHGKHVVFPLAKTATKIKEMNRTRKLDCMLIRSQLHLAFNRIMNDEKGKLSESVSNAN